MAESIRIERLCKVEVLKDLLQKKKRLGVPQTEICFVDDFAPDAILIEKAKIEIGFHATGFLKGGGICENLLVLHTTAGGVCPGERVL